jgi:propionate CoA-transferase
MLSLPAGPGQAVRPTRFWKIVSPAEGASAIPDGATVAVGWLGDPLGMAMEAGFLQRQVPRDLTIVYATASGHGRTHGLNRLAHPGLVRRVIGGQWNPVPALQALARTERIEAYSLPVGMIGRLLRAAAAGADGRIGRGGLVHLVRTAGEPELMAHTFPIDVALIPVGFLEGSAAIAMPRDAMTMARAARANGGLVIGQTRRIGTLDRLPLGQVVAPDSLLDLLIGADEGRRLGKVFAAPAAAGGFAPIRHVQAMTIGDRSATTPPAPLPSIPPAPFRRRPPTSRQ